MMFRCWNKGIEDVINALVFDIVASL